MDQQQLKEYARLNLLRSGLKIEGKDRQTASDLNKDIDTIRKADKALLSMSKELKERRENGGLYYSSMGLIYWALLVCLPMFAMYWSEYKEGILPVIGESYYALMYILPAIFLVVRLFVMFSFINFGHLAILAVCTVMNILKIRIFGSEMNWMWVFLVTGTVLTLIGRIVEYFRKVRPNLVWYKEKKAEIRKAEPFIDRGAVRYNSIGADAAQEMKTKFPGKPQQARSCWFNFQRKIKEATDRKDCDRIIIPELPHAHTDFLTPAKDIETVQETERFTLHATVTVTNQSMGYQTIPMAKAMKDYLQSGKLKPFFGMEVGEHSQELEYRIYAHRWEETIQKIYDNHYVKTTYVNNQARQQAEWDLETIEYRHLGTSAKNAQLHTNSWADHYMYQSYLDKKQAILDKIPEKIGIDRYVSDREKDVRYHKYFELAMLAVQAPDGSLVGLYSGETKEAIEFCAMTAKQNWGAELTPASNPTTDAQKAYLYHRFLLS